MCAVGDSCLVIYLLGEAAEGKSIRIEDGLGVWVVSSLVEDAVARGWVGVLVLVLVW